MSEGYTLQEAQVVIQDIKLQVQEQAVQMEKNGVTWQDVLNGNTGYADIGDLEAAEE